MLRIVRNTVAPALVLLSSVSASTGAQTPSVSGRVTVIDRGDKVARDVGQAVVWLETGESAAVTPDTVQIAMSDKEFSPRVVVVPTGSTIGFPNNDPFNHNVFSLSPEGPFDLGLYGRREAKSTTLNQPGILRVYCNVHARMSALPRTGPSFSVTFHRGVMYYTRGTREHRRSSVRSKSPHQVRRGSTSNSMPGGSKRPST